MNLYYTLRAIMLGLLVQRLIFEFKMLRLPLPCLLRAVDIPPERLPSTPMSLDQLNTNHKLKQAHKLFEGKIRGSESVAISPTGELFMLDRQGYLYLARYNGTDYNLNENPIAYAGPGRPLGFHLDGQGGNVYICDSLKGLTKLEIATGKLEILANRISAESENFPLWPIYYANDLDIASDGSIYFTSSGNVPPALNRLNFYDTMNSYLLTVWAGSADGKILKYNPTTGKTVALNKQGIWFANGIALAEDESFALVVETPSMRVLKHWLKGERSGETEVILDNLPAFPDGITRSSDGDFWLALVVPDMPALRYALSLGKYFRWAFCWFTQKVVAPKIRQAGMAMKITADGRILQVLMDADGSHISSVSALTEYKGRLFFGNLGGSYVSYLDINSE